MQLQPNTYELSLEADNDIQEIYAFTAAKFGIDQAIRYLLGFEDLFNQLCLQPHTGRHRGEIKEGLRSIGYVSHVVFYRVMDTRIRIVRVLHSSRDMSKFL